MTTAIKPHKHFFLLGRCEHCGLSRTDYHQAQKEHRREMDRKRWAEKRRVA